MTQGTVGTVLMRIQQDYDVNVLHTNHQPIIWLSCIVNGPEKTQFYPYLTNDKARNGKLKYTLNEPKCAVFRVNAYRTMHWDAD